MVRVLLVQALLPGVASSAAAPRATANASRARATLERALRLDDLGEMPRAVKSYERAAALAHASGDTAVEAEARRGLGLALTFIGRAADGRKELDEARTLAERSGDARGVALTDYALGYALGSTDRKESKRRLAAALAAFEALGDEVEQARTLSRMTFPAEQRDSMIERGLALARRHGEAEIEARFLATMADERIAQGDFQTALPLLDEGIRLLGRAPMSKTLGSIYNVLGNLYQYHGDYEKALGFYRRSLVIRRHLPRVRAATIHAMGTALEKSGRPEEAARLYRRAIALAQEANAPRVVAYASLNLADLSLRLRHPRAAARVLEKLLAEKLDESLRVRVEITLADAYVALGRTADAEPLLREALGNGVDREDLEVRVRGLRSLSRLYRAQGKDAEALGALQEGREFLQRKRALLLPDDALRQVYSYDQTLFDELVDQLFSTGRQVPALEAAEEARGRAFLDLLARRGSDTPCEGRPATFLDVVETAGRLRSTVVSTFVTENAMFLWVVSPDATVHAVRVPVGEARVAALVSEAQGDDRPLARRRRALRLLYDVLVAPVRASLPRERGARLTIVPHGPLVLLSFAALRAPTGRYLLEDYAIHYAPAVGFFSYAGEPLSVESRAGTEDSDTLVVANPSPLPADARSGALAPLPGAVREAGAVRALRPSAVVLTREEATKSAVRVRAGGVDVLHFATHAVVVRDRPAESFLALSTSDGGDGKLTARDVYGLRLRAGLVFLSSCRSAVGKVSADGVLGLSRAFLTAGASSVVAAMWDVADEVEADVVQGFYRGMRRGEERDRALRGAQLELLNRLRRARVRLPGPLGPTSAPEDPAYWAGLVLVGEP